MALAEGSMTFRRNLLSLACLVTVLAQGVARADDVTTAASDSFAVPSRRARIAHAAAAGRTVTGVAIVAGSLLAYGGAHANGKGEGVAIAGGVLGGFGVLMGPAIGWGMRGDYLHAAAGVAARGAGVALMTAGFAESFEDADSGGKHLLVGAVVVLGSFTWDLVTVGHVPREDRTSSLRLEPALLAAPDGRLTYGLTARARF